MLYHTLLERYHESFFQKQYTIHEARAIMEEKSFSIILIKFFNPFKSQTCQNGNKTQDALC